jgi:hypothetical protein
VDFRVWGRCFEIGSRLFILVGSQCPAPLWIGRRRRWEVIKLDGLNPTDERPNQEQDGVRVEDPSPIVLVKRCFFA